MSWFKRSPKTKEPSRQVPHQISPMTEKRLEEAKQTGPSKKKATQKPKQ